MPLRVAIVAVVAVVLFGVIFFRLWFLQVLSSEEMLAKADENRLRSIKIEAPRGSVLDRNGDLIVENRAGLAVGIRLADIPEGQLGHVVDRLARLLKVSPESIRKKLEARTSESFKRLNEGVGNTTIELIIVKPDAKMNTVSYLLEHKASYPGVEVRKTFLRNYPNGRMAAHVLGYVREIDKTQLESKHFKDYKAGDIVGQTGLEWTYDSWLRGRDGETKIEVNAGGRPRAEGTTAGGRLPQPGNSLVTTIDSKVQRATENALVQSIKLAHETDSWDANGGAAVVLDARNGEVISMASYPSFNPKVWVGGISSKQLKRLYAKKKNYPAINRVIESSSAVGSTYKAITAVAALEEGVVEPSTQFFCPGDYKVPIDKSPKPTLYKCWISPGGHGSLDLVGALTQSCDVYFYNIGYRFYARSGSPLATWSNRLGLGKPTNVDIPGELDGLVPTPEWRQKYFKNSIDKIWKPGNSVHMAIGQGDLRATPLQLAVSYAAIANGGTIVTPHLGKRVVDGNGKMVRDLSPGNAGNIDISQSTLGVVRRGLREAASSSSGTSAAVFSSYPVAVAGKTGTAEVWDSQRKTYVNYAWYASFAPYDNPRYVTVFMVEKGGHGGTVAAPATRLIYDALFSVNGGAITAGKRGD